MSHDVNSHGWIRDSLRMTHQAFWQIFVRYWHWLLGIGILSMVLDEFTFEFEHYLSRFSEVPPTWSLLLILVSLVWSVASNLVIVIIACLGMASTKTCESPWRVINEKLAQLIIESLRVIGYSLCWVQALVIPGVIKYLRWTFVPFIVLFDADYQRGEVDALARSNKIIRGHTLAIFLCFIIFFVYLIVIDLISSTLTSGFRENPLGSVVSEMLTTLGSLYAAGFLYAAYKNLNGSNDIKSASAESDPV